MSRVGTGVRVACRERARAPPFPLSLARLSLSAQRKRGAPLTNRAKVWGKHRRDLPDRRPRPSQPLRVAVGTRENSYLFFATRDCQKACVLQLRLFTGAACKRCGFTGCVWDAAKGEGVNAQQGQAQASTVCNLLPLAVRTLHEKSFASERALGPERVPRNAAF